jgi:Domain of unknown function (DUF4124)
MRYRAAAVIPAVAWLLAGAGPAGAAVYRWVDEDSVVNYSDDRSLFDAHRRRVGADRDDPLPAPPPGVAEPPDAPALLDAAGRRRSEDTAAEMMRLAGLGQQCDLLSAMIQADLGRWRWGSGRAAGDTLTQTFSAEGICRNVHRALVRQVDPSLTGSLLPWVRTPLSQRIVALEQRSASPDRRKEQAAFVNLMPSTPPPPARLALIHRLERAADVTENSAMVLAGVRAAVRKAVAPLVGPAVMATRAADGQAALRAPIGEQFRLHVMLALLFAYAELHDADLGRYVSFLESTTGRWFTRITHRAFLAALETPVERGPSATVSAPGRSRARCPRASRQRAARGGRRSRLCESDIEQRDALLRRRGGAPMPFGAERAAEVERVYRAYALE